MSYLEDYNKIYSSSGNLIIAPARIRQYIDFKNYLVIRTDPKEGDPEYPNQYEGGNVICYDEFGKPLWVWRDKDIASIQITNEKLNLYDPSGLGYGFIVKISDGSIIEHKIIK